MMEKLRWSHGAATLDAILADGSLWFSAGTLGHLLGTSVQNITIMSRDSAGAGRRRFPISKTEGTRLVRRNILHFPLDFAVECAARGRRPAAMDALLSLAERHGVRCGAPASKVRLSRREHRFGDLLDKVLRGVTAVERQRAFGSRLLDFYLPKLRLGVEYDEWRHRYQAAADGRRQAEIESRHGIEVIRAKQGEELACVNAILRRLARRRSSLS